MSGIIRTDSSHPHFLRLVALLDADLAQRDGAEHGFYATFNKVDALRNVVVLYEEDRPVACGAFKELAPGTVEIKRMYTQPESRGRGHATQVLQALEAWAAELSYKKCVLETGRRQPEAIALYNRNGYEPIPNYGPYAGVENSVCFAKEIN